MKYKKISYLPGMVSCICLPILLYFFMPEPRQTPVALTLIVPAPPSPDKGKIQFSTTLVRRFLKHKKVISLELPSESIMGEDLLEYRYWSAKAYVWDELRIGNLKRDTNIVFRVDLTEDHNYKDFVWLVNLAKVHGYHRYIYMDNSFYFFPDPPYHPDLFISLPKPELEAYATLVNNEPTQWQIFKRKWNNYFEEWVFMVGYYKWISLSFCILILLPFVFWLIKHRRIQKAGNGG